ncbi:MAG: SAM hydroxide adenosyltransferase [Candidatus Nanohaloarchaea archaeon]
MSTWKPPREKDEKESGKTPEEFLLHFVADYSLDRNLSFTEVRQALWDRGIRNVNDVSVPPFSTLAAGFIVEQLGLHSSGRRALYVNVAPRKDDRSSRNRNEGEPLVYAELESGVPIVATDSGEIFSFVRESVKEMRSLEVPRGGSQFRSRDIFPEAVSRVLRREKEVLGSEIDREIPEPPGSEVAYIDGFGNLKTTVRRSEIDHEGEVTVTVSGSETRVRVADGIFGVEEGEFVLAPGSSGGEDPYMELVKRGGNAEKQLDAEIGDKIKISEF